MKKMASERKGGSVLLMVVGLLTMLAMLGGTFLIVSRLDAKQSEALAERGGAEALASGGVAKIVEALAADLHFGNGEAPYSESASGADGWPHYTDYASKATDAHLAPVEGAVVGNADTDGDGTNDADLSPTGVRTADGREYQMALRVPDLSRFICVSTAALPDLGLGDPPTRAVPALIDLYRFITPAVWSNASGTGLNNLRCGGPTRGAKSINDNLAMRVLSPVSPYIPFSIGDEPFLRWLKTPSSVESGRLYSAISSVPVATRRLLTTFPSERALLRSPAAGKPAFRVPLTQADALNSVEARETFYQAICRATGSDNGEGGGVVEHVETTIIDDGGAGFSTVENWGWDAVGYRGRAHCAKRSESGAKARWTFTATRHMEYEVSITWPPLSWSATNAVFRIYDGTAGSGQVLGQFTINQQNSPGGGGAHDGVTWQKLGGKYKISSNNLTVELSNEGADGYVSADAVRIFTRTYTTGVGNGSKQAAHLVANLWASMDGDTFALRQRKAYEFKPSEGDVQWSVYGVVEQPFITEAFATHTHASEDDKGDYKWACAIELMNPTGTAITLTDRYKLVIGDNEIALTGTIPAKGGKVVLYNFGKGASAGTVGESDFGFELATKGWYKLPAKDGDDDPIFTFLGSPTIHLVRRAQDKDIRVDWISSTDLDYSFTLSQVKNDGDGDETNKATEVTKDIRRDDSLGRARYSVAKYKSFGDDKLKDVNGVTTAAGSLPTNEVAMGFPIKLAGKLPYSIGDLADLYIVGPEADNDGQPTQDLPHALVPYATDNGRGRANALGQHASYTGKWDIYPNTIPWPCSLAEIIETVPTTMRDLDPGEPDIYENDQPRIYGRINISTANADVLRRLPWPATITFTKADGTPETCAVGALAAANGLITYREKHGGFLTPGEAAVALAEEYVDKSFPGYTEACITLYKAIAACIGVNSDTYAVNILVQLGANPSDDEKWHYVAVIDRSCCTAKADKPAVLLFTHVK